MKESFSFRLEMGGKGIFYGDKYGEVVLILQQQLSLQPGDTFLHHYCYNMYCPYDYGSVDRFLSKYNEGFEFGFVSLEAMERAFGLTNPEFRKQFDFLLDNGICTLKVGVVQYEVAFEQEVLYWKHNFHLIE